MIRLACSKCGRSLRQPVEIGGAMYGSTCARGITGARAKRVRRPRASGRDDRTADLFAEARP